METVATPQTTIKQPAIDPIQPTQTATSEVNQPPTTQAKTRTRTATTATVGLYDKLGKSIAMVGGIGFAGLLWVAGAYYTLRGLSAFGINTDEIAWWILPAIITAIELWLMPKRGTRWQTILMFLAILAFDVLTSWYGLLSDLGGKSLPLATGITMPTGGVMFHLLCVVISLGCAFLPEKLGKHSIKELFEVWA